MHEKKGVDRTSIATRRNRLSLEGGMAILSELIVISLKVREAEACAFVMYTAGGKKTWGKERIKKQKRYRKGTEACRNAEKMTRQRNEYAVIPYWGGGRNFGFKSGDHRGRKTTNKLKKEDGVGCRVL